MSVCRVNSSREPSGTVQGDLELEAVFEALLTRLLANVRP